MVTCSVDGTSKYILGPAEVEGQDVKDAASGAELNQQGAPTGGYEIRLSFNGKGTKEFGDVTTRLVAPAAAAEPVRDRPGQPGHLRPADQRGHHQRLGEHHRQLHRRRAPGCWPTRSSSARCRCPSRCRRRTTSAPSSAPTSCRRACIAGAIGLLLVVLYSLFQYRALGLVTVASLLVAVGDHLRRGHAARLVARLPADHGRRHRPDRRRSASPPTRSSSTSNASGTRSARAGRCAPRSTPAGSAPGAPS